MTKAKLVISLNNIIEIKYSNEVFFDYYMEYEFKGTKLTKYVSDFIEDGMDIYAFLVASCIDIRDEEYPEVVEIYLHRTDGISLVALYTKETDKIVRVK